MKLVLLVHLLIFFVSCGTTEKLVEKYLGPEDISKYKMKIVEKGVPKAGQYARNFYEKKVSTKHADKVESIVKKSVNQLIELIK